MEIIKDCILMKDPSTFSYDSAETTTNPYTIGILLAVPLHATTLSFLSTLLSISQNEEIPNTIRLGSLCKFFRHFSDIQRYIEVKLNRIQVFSLLSTACECMNTLFDLKESREIKDFLLKSFKNSIERLTFEFRTQLDVLRIVTCAMKYKIFSDFPSIIFKIPAKVIENALNYENLPFLALFSTIEDIWRIIKSFQPKDFDPIKNVGFFLVCELIQKTDESSMTQTSGLLFNYSEQMISSQEFKVLALYKLLCEKIGTDIDEGICSKLGEVKKNYNYEPSPWDLVDEIPLFMEVETKQQIPEIVQRVIESLKSMHMKEYLKYEVIEKEILGISKSFQKDKDQIFQTISSLILNDDKSKMRFWKTFASAARKLRFFSFDQTKGISDLISKVEKGESVEVVMEVKKISMTRDKLQEIIDKDLDANSPNLEEFEKMGEEIERFQILLQEEFPLCEIQPVGSIVYKLYQRGSAIDMQILSQDGNSEEFERTLTEYLGRIGEVLKLPGFIQYRYILTYHLYLHSKLPQVTNKLISRYNQAQNVNSFLQYIKIWGKTLNLADSSSKGYFWTVLGLFYLCNSTPPVLKNLVSADIHQLEPLEGYDIWSDPNDYPSLDTSTPEIFKGFLGLLIANLGAVFNTETGEISKSSEYLWAVTDFFTRKSFGIALAEKNRIEKQVRGLYEEISGI